MAHNRKHQSAAVRLEPVLKVLLLCLFVGGSGVGYVWQKNQLLQLSSEFSGLEKELEARRHENQVLKNHLAERLQPEAIEAKVREFNLRLVPTSTTNILHVTDTPIDPAAALSYSLESQRLPDDRLSRGLAARD